MIGLSAFSLEGRTILVTGANTGIGQGIAVSAANAGAKVIGVGRSSLDETATLIGDAFVPVTCDLANHPAALAMLGEVERSHGPIHGLVNNAGIIRRADSVDHSETDWDDVMDINLKAVFLLSQAFAKTAIATARPGKIVNIASLLSFQGGIRVAAYTASKHGLAGLTKVMANEWAGQGINVNAIAPGYVESNNTSSLRADPDRSEAIIARVPAGRWGKPSDIGGAAVFLLSSASDYMHGAIIPIDGGWLSR